MTRRAMKPLVQRLRDQMRDEVTEIGLDLFLSEGFETTTIDDICRASGISKRSFFRYFGAKEDIVLSHFSRIASLGCAEFVAHSSTEGVWMALRSSMNPFVEWVQSDVTRGRGILRLIDSSESLRSAYLFRVDQWTSSLTKVLAEQVEDTKRDELYIPVIAAAALAALTTGARIWAQSDSADLSATIDKAFAALRATPQQ